MNPDASALDRWQAPRPRQGGLVWASVVTILFATLSVISFGVDQTVTFSPAIEAPAPPTSP